VQGTQGEDAHLDSDRGSCGGEEVRLEWICNGRGKNDPSSGMIVPRAGKREGKGILEAVLNKKIELILPLGHKKFIHRWKKGGSLDALRANHQCQ